MTGHGVRTLAVSALAAAIAIRVSAGQPVRGAYARIAADPSGALHQAADGWSVSGTLGDASAQGLRDIPLAAFFWLTDIIGVPAAGGRAAWCSLVLVLAVVGGVRLALTRYSPNAGAGRQEEPLAPWTPWVAASLFACAPVVVTSAQRSPGDGLVVALLPWLLVPIVRGERGWRPAARSSAWLGLAGAGSPTWAFAALITGFVAAAAAARGPGGVRQLLRWALLAALASAWWVAAFAWESAYASEITRLVSDEPAVGVVSDALGLPAEGTAWLVLVVLGPFLVAVVALVLGAVRDRLLVASLLAAAMAAGLAWWAYDGRGAWLPVWSSAASATESVPVPWMPLFAWVAVAGLVAWCPLVENLQERLPVAGSWPWTPQHGVAVAGAVVIGLAALAGPVLAAQEPRMPDDPVADVDQWARVAAWSAAAPPGRVLVLPADPGTRIDGTVMEALGDRPWVARDHLPVSGAAATAALDDAVWRISRGHAGPGTASALRRLGISYVLVRNDVSPAADRERPLALIRHALAGQGASRVAVSAKRSDAAPAIVDLGIRDSSGSVEIWALEDNADGAVHEGPLVTVAGDQGVVGDLAAAGVEPTGALQLAPVQAEGVEIVSDSARRRDVDQRAALDPFGPDLRADEARTLVPPGAARQPTAFRRFEGARAIEASSSAADLGGVQRQAGADPSAAVDGNGFTAWQSRRGAVVGEWWEITFDQPTDLSQASARIFQNAFASHLVTQVALESDAGATSVAVAADGLVGLAPAGLTTRLRIVATGMQGRVSDTSSFGILELDVPGLDVVDQLVVSASETSTWVLAARPGSFATCVPSMPFGGPDDAGASATVCNRGVSVDGPDPGALNRVLVSERSATVAGRIWMRAADSAASSELADKLAGPTVTVTGSSVASPDLVTRPQAAADADPTTAWRPAPEDDAPTLDLTWRRRAEVSGVRVLSPGSPLSSRPTHVVVRYGQAPEAAVVAEIGGDGVVEIPPVKTRSLSVTFQSAEHLTSVDSVTGAPRRVPVAISEIEVLGGPPARYGADDVEKLPCGSGPTVTVDGERFESAVTTSARQVVDASVVAATLCDRPVIGVGEASVEVGASFSWIPLGLVLSPPDGPLGPVDVISPAEHVATTVSAGVIASDPTTRVVDVEADAAGPSTVVLAVPAGAGWTAEVNSRELPALVVDGWAQGWQVPEGATRLTLRYASGEVLRLSVGLAALGWLVVLMLAVGSRPRTRRPWAGPAEERRDHAMVGRSTQA